MSLFKGERVYPNVVHWQPFSQPSLVGVPTEGTSWYDAAQKTLYLSSAGNQVAGCQFLGNNVTAVTATNPSSTATLMSVPFPANSFNAVGKTLHVRGAGYYNGAGAVTLTFNVNLGATEVLTFASGAVTNAANDMPWSVDGYITLQANGTGGAVEAHGFAAVVLGATNTAGSTVYLDQNFANVAFNTQTVSNVNMSVLGSASNASVVVVQRFINVELED